MSTSRETTCVCVCVYIYIYTQICTAGCNSYLPPSDLISVEVIVMARPNPILKLCNIAKMPPFHILILPWEQKSHKERGWGCRGGGIRPTNLFLAKRRCSADVAYVRESLAALDSISVEDF